MYNRCMTKTCCNIRYRLILSDIQMPEIDGFGVARQIKQIEQQLRIDNPFLPQVMIVFVTAYSDNYVRAKA